MIDRDISTSFEPSWDEVSHLENSLIRDPEELLIELEALNVVLNAVEGFTGPEGVRDFVRTALSNRQATDSIEEQLVSCCMNHIAGFPSEEMNLTSSKTWTDHVTKTIIRSWVLWTKGQAEAVKNELSTLKNQQRREEFVEERFGAVNLMTLYFWLSAIESLNTQDLKNSKKWWKRAIEVGSAFGTPSNLLVQWTYAATFFALLS